MVLAAETPAGGPPWLAATLMGVAGLAPLITAFMPYLVEKVKQRPKPTPPPDPPTQLPATTEAVSRADKALDLIEVSMRDLRKQRDDAEREVRRLQRLLNARETELRKRGWDGR